MRHVHRRLADRSNYSFPDLLKTIPIPLRLGILDFHEWNQWPFRSLVDPTAVAYPSTRPLPNATMLPRPAGNPPVPCVVAFAVDNDGKVQHVGHVAPGDWEEDFEISHGSSNPDDEDMRKKRPKFIHLGPPKEYGNPRLVLLSPTEYFRTLYGYFRSDLARTIFLIRRVLLVEFWLVGGEGEGSDDSKSWRKMRPGDDDDSSSHVNLASVKFDLHVSSYVPTEGLRQLKVRRCSWVAGGRPKRSEWLLHPNVSVPVLYDGGWGSALETLGTHSDFNDASLASLSLPQSCRRVSVSSRTLFHGENASRNARVLSEKLQHVRVLKLRNGYFGGFSSGEIKLPPSDAYAPESPVPLVEGAMKVPLADLTTFYENLQLPEANAVSLLCSPMGGIFGYPNLSHVEELCITACAVGSEGIGTALRRFPRLRKVEIRPAQPWKVAFATGRPPADARGEEYVRALSQSDLFRLLDGNETLQQLSFPLVCSDALLGTPSKQPAFRNSVLKLLKIDYLMLESDDPAKPAGFLRSLLWPLRECLEDLRFSYGRVVVHSSVPRVGIPISTLSFISKEMTSLRRLDAGWDGPKIHRWGGRDVVKYPPGFFREVVANLTKLQMGAFLLNESSAHGMTKLATAPSLRHLRISGRPRSLYHVDTLKYIVGSSVRILDLSDGEWNEAFVHAFPGVNVLDCGKDQLFQRIVVALDVDSLVKKRRIATSALLSSTTPMDDAVVNMDITFATMRPLVEASPDHPLRACLRDWPLLGPYELEKVDWVSLIGLRTAENGRNTKENGGLVANPTASLPRKIGEMIPTRIPPLSSAPRSIVSS